LNFGQQILYNLGQNYKSRGSEKIYGDTGVVKSEGDTGKDMYLT